MRIHQAINKYKENINDSIYRRRPFTMIGCGPGCNCVQGIIWDDLEFYNQKIKVKNGYEFRLSVDLSNELERFFWPLIQPERIGHTWEENRFCYTKIHR